MTHFRLWAALLGAIAAAWVGDGRAADELLLADAGHSEYTIIIPAAATAVEQTAARELQEHLAAVTGVRLPIIAEGQAVDGEKQDAKPATSEPGPQTGSAAGKRETKRILVGQCRGTAELLPELDAAALGADGVVVRTCGPDLILIGQGARGTLYAVYTFLEDIVGCRWWTSTESLLPHKPTLRIEPQNVGYAPQLQSREAFYRDAFDPVLAARLKLNGHFHGISDNYGGHLSFCGFVHTFYPLIPPAKYFSEHPEWYSEINGRRTTEHAQLCLTNDAMRRELTKNVLANLRNSPGAKFVSISQNDWHGRCECEACRAVEQEEGAPSGLMLRFVNAVAESVEREFPDVLVETLAYQYTREPPRVTKPRHNVIIRLCSIECSFVETLADGPQNEKFKRDIEGWSKIAPQLFIWDYVTNFSNYILPHANLRVLAPNIRFFVDHHVTGLFEQGDAGSSVGDFVRMRAWVIAHLLWQPQRDAQALFREFLEGYYGPAAPHLQAYLDLIHDGAEQSGVYLRCFMNDTSGWLKLDRLNQATRLFEQAAQAVADDPVLAERVRRERLPLDHAWLQRYNALKRAARMSDAEFLGPSDPQAAVEDFIRLCRQWKVGQYREGQAFENYEPTLRSRVRPPAPPPEQCRDLPPERWFDAQDNQFNLAGEGRWAQLVDDPQASDGRAARMPGDHYEWAVQLRMGDDFVSTDRWRVYVCARVEALAADGPAMTMGIYDADAKRGVAHRSVAVSDAVGDQYRVFELGAHVLTKDTYLWAAPPKRPGEVTAVYIDRVFFVRQDADP